MFPWGHLATGYLASRGRLSRTASPHLSALVLTFATQLPDLVDKTFAWYVPVLPSGRSLAHSLLTATLFLGVVWVALARVDREAYATVFGIGYLSHLGGDALHPVVTADWASLTFLVWPLLPLPSYQGPTGASLILGIEPSPFVLFELGLTLFAVALWVLDDAPGLAILTRPRAALGLGK
ncbi:metal-dependent hydrolase [Haloarculaceae archaeon H-GB11]|nr:metal-dependent hydrolase [Haloarculaceae archaeon H-GB11]